ncbi:MAG: CNNM domain-containing protein, partial [Gammaproteobacteria bacterium]|nr:CNNM domain-containing protein [Gammaproteobacteria bacterium]
MSDIPIGYLFASLIFLIFLSAFFSSSETGMMSLNRYRLRHLVKQKHRGAIRAAKLLQRPDRLIGVILIGNNFVNILASAIATMIALRLMGNAGVAVATAILTLVILIFAEVTPKTVAALRPERIAFPASL